MNDIPALLGNIFEVPGSNAALVSTWEATNISQSLFYKNGNVFKLTYEEGGIVGERFEH